MWFYQHSKGELQTLFTQMKHTLLVSTYQMSVLLLFNKQTIWLVEQIQETTQISKEILLQILYHLLKVRLLTCEEINLNEEFTENDIHSNYHIKLSENFKR
jgi:cullin 1